MAYIVQLRLQTPNETVVTPSFMQVKCTHHASETRDKQVARQLRMVTRA